MKLQLMIEKILESKVQVTETDIDQYIEQNAASFPEETDFEAIRNTIKDQLLQQRMSQQFNEWMAGLRSEADIQNFIEY